MDNNQCLQQGPQHNPSWLVLSSSVGCQQFMLRYHTAHPQPATELVMGDMLWCACMPCWAKQACRSITC
jgi:hypothetical protein